MGRKLDVAVRHKEGAPSTKAGAAKIGLYRLLHEVELEQRES
jgi:hypothetical protein